MGWDYAHSLKVQKYNILATTSQKFFHQKKETSSPSQLKLKQRNAKEMHHVRVPLN